MAAAACTEEEFLALWEKYRSPGKVALAIGVSVRNVHARRRAIESRRGVALGVNFAVTVPEDNVRVRVDIEDGILLVASDCHYWPGIVSTAHRALVQATRELRPKAVVINGDAFDGASAGRHDRVQWEARPSVKQELEAVQDRLGEVESAAGSAKLLWTWGNHDARFSSRLSARVPEFEGVDGFRLEDHFPFWRFSTSIMVNDHTMIKHRWHNGVHATWNNVVKAGVSMVTGHLHALQVRPYTDYNGTRYAVDTGTLACPTGEQFTYAEDAPANHRSGFAVLTFHRGKLLPPELLEVVDEDEGLVCFRGQVVKV